MSTSSVTGTPNVSAQPLLQAINAKASTISLTLWLLATFAVAALVYYFIGFDQGATSIFGNDTHVHEFVHDARHFLGFPCH